MKIYIREKKMHKITRTLYKQLYKLLINVFLTHAIIYLFISFIYLDVRFISCERKI